ncbi:hypothetical protein KIH87_06455 [Paraneptunicella aestuarii]|uniref:EF-hand domain-containing protein n=1 Tax=Paraneptunicella aestuarii TaxID=2831148 RepID=UPI001E41B8F1|nr:hypothetical protein [Paraneptunicella aestuarii]UAA39988.1 hypothetical protein KIH87_06455 [Paraneptunicella aestuarii]
MKTMNKNAISALLAALTVTTLIAAPIVHAKGRGHGGHHGANTEFAFSRLDTSGDGNVDSSELTAQALARAENMFNRKDANDDGFLSLEEATTGRRGEAPDHSDIAADIIQCVTDLKAETGNDNIIIPDADLFQSPEDRFSAADTSGDGVLDLTEVQAKATEKATEGFALMDADSDGLVTLEEFTAHREVMHETHNAVRHCIHELTSAENVI